MRRFIDSMGDRWEEQSDGTLSLTDHPTASAYQEHVRSEVERIWGPLTELDPKPSDSPIYVTRAELADALSAIRDWAFEQTDTTVWQLDSIIDTFRGRA